MALKIILIGKTSSGFAENGTQEYLKRLSKYIKVDWLEMPDIKRSAKLSSTEVKRKEADLINKVIKPSDYLVLLDEKGKQYSSVEFASFIEKGLVNNPSFTLVVGGAYGFDESIYERANGKLSLSKMTFSHQMIRIFLAEQVYRAFTILKGDPYHNQ